MPIKTPDRPWLCALRKTDQQWQWGGDDKEAAINAGLEIWGGERRPDGFWIAPAHESKTEDDSDDDYTVETDKAEWVPLR